MGSARQALRRSLRESNATSGRRRSPGPMPASHRCSRLQKPPMIRTSQHDARTSMSAESFNRGSHRASPHRKQRIRFPVGRRGQIPQLCCSISGSQRPRSTTCSHRSGAYPPFLLLPIHAPNLRPEIAQVEHEPILRERQTPAVRSRLVARVGILDFPTSARRRSSTRSPDYRLPPHRIRSRRPSQMSAVARVPDERLERLGNSRNRRRWCTPPSICLIFLPWHRVVRGSARNSSGGCARWRPLPSCCGPSHRMPYRTPTRVSILSPRPRHSFSNSLWPTPRCSCAAPIRPPERGCRISRSAWRRRPSPRLPHC